MAAVNTDNVAKPLTETVTDCAGVFMLVRILGSGADQREFCGSVNLAFAAVLGETKFNVLILFVYSVDAP